ncbi:TonB family protein [bacterium]|nr:TonB family protein [bacterium]
MSFRKLFFSSLIIICCSITTLASSSHASDQLVLNGTAIHTSLQLDYYYAALFSESQSEDAQTLLWQDNQRMEITILVDEWSKRRFTQHLGQAIAINNTTDDQEHHAKDIATFNTLFKDYLIRGDRIVISKDIDKGTEISINGLTLMETKSHDFFTLFLNTWLGARPPSSIFKASILGQEATVDSHMMTSYESLTASATRINDLKAWNKQKPSKRKSSPVKIDQEKVTKEIIEEKTVAANTIDKKYEPIIIEVQPRYVDTTEHIESADMTTTIATEHSPLNFDEEDITTTTNLKKSSHPDAANELSADEKSLLLPAPNATDDVLEKNALADINAQKKHLLKLYRSTILTSTYKKIVYPSSAIDKNQQGKVVLKVTVDRSGKVQSIDLKEKSKFKLLNKAADRAVTKAHFPSVPSELEGDEFEFLLPIKFSLN